QTFEHSNNYYADSSYYFISFNQPGSAKHIETIAANTAADLEINTFNDYAAIDVDSYSVSHIGKVWWSHRMNSSGSSSLTQNLNINLGAHTGPIQMEVYVGNTSDAGNNNMRLSINGEFLKNMALGATSQYSLVAVHQTNFEYTSSTNNLN